MSADARDRDKRFGEAINSRRADLIDAEIHGRISLGEAAELALLQAAADWYLSRQPQPIGMPDYRPPALIKPAELAVLRRDAAEAERLRSELSDAREGLRFAIGLYNDVVWDTVQDRSMDSHIARAKELKAALAAKPETDPS